MAENRWDLAFENMAHIPNATELPGIWAERAAQYRTESTNANRRIDIDVPYGEHAREVFDLVWPDTQPKGLVVFVHGGYWIRLDKSYWTDLAEGARANGWAVCLPSYTLAPEARISSITQQIARAIGNASEQVAGPIRLAGHSAGGHLVSRLICADTALIPSVLQRIEHTVSISGLHDLRPLLYTTMNETLKLDISEAVAESAGLQMPSKDASVTAWVGGGERPEFIRQSRLLCLLWEGLDANVSCTIDATHNHFSVIEALKEADSELMLELLKNLS